MEEIKVDSTHEKDLTPADNSSKGDVNASKTMDDVPTQSGDSNKAEGNDATPVDGAPSRSEDLSKTLPEEAFNHFVQGKRHLLVRDYTSGVQSLAIACELYVKHFGELAIECGEVYFLYGKALVRYAQNQSQRGVISLDKVHVTPHIVEDTDSSEDEENESESGEDKEKESEKNGSATEENEAEADDKDEAEAEDKDLSESTDSPQNAENDTEPKGEAEKKTETNAAEADVSVQNESSNEENPEAEEDDLEIAWNILEAAKTIFMRQGEDNKEAQGKVAEILQLLADTSLETDNYLQAINDLKACLAIQEKILPPDDRVLAQTFYQLGLSYMLVKMYSEAVENFRKTVTVFEIRKENLLKNPVSDTVGGFEALEWKKEMEDVVAIMSDVKEKIEDTEDLARNAKKELQEAILKKKKDTEKAFGKSSGSSVSGSKPVSNITHLLKRKKPEEEGKESESKRIKTSPVVPNGESTVAK